MKMQDEKIFEAASALIDVLAGMQQSIIDDAIVQWSRHLHNCMRIAGQRTTLEYSL